MRPICPNPKCGVAIPENAGNTYTFYGLGGPCITIFCKRCGVVLGIVPQPKS